MSVTALRPVTVAIIQCTVLAALAVLPAFSPASSSRLGNVAMTVLSLGIYQGVYYAWMLALAATTRAIPAHRIPILSAVLALFVVGCLYITLSASRVPFFLAFFVGLIVLQLVLYAAAAALAARLATRHGRQRPLLSSMGWWLLLATGLAIPGATAIVQARAQRLVRDLNPAVA